MIGIVPWHRRNNNMTKYIPTLYLLIFFCRFGFAETYTWEDYDDFSVSSLDTKKWGVSCWEGGNLPIISNGRVLLAGKTNSTWNQAVATSRMLGINPNAASILAGGGEAHSVLEFKESDDIYGIELYFIDYLSVIVIALILEAPFKI